MTILILFDWKVTVETRHWLQEGLEKNGHKIELIGIPDYTEKDRTSSFGMIRLWFKYFILACKGIKNSKANDTIISWNFVAGAMVGYLCELFGFNRKIISLNMIAHEKGFINSILRKQIYNKAFRYKSFWFSVNDEQLMTYYSSLFTVDPKKIFILHDVYSKSYEQCDYNKYDHYVFTGGEAYRDWSNFIKCADSLPEIQFIGVARYMNFPHNRKLPKNLKMYYDISEDEFYSFVKKCRIVFLPLTSQAPCGLIVIIRAALLSKPVIITETPSTKNYISNEYSGILVKMHDVSMMENSIKKLYYSEDLSKLYAENLKEYILKNYSFERNIKIIEEIIQTR